MSTSQRKEDARVIAGSLVLILALGATEALLYQLGGLGAAVAFPVVALLWWVGYRLVTVPAPQTPDGNADGNVGEPVLVERERPAADQPHTW